jgi:hypothetical protein
MKLPDPLATAYGATLAPMRLAQMLAATGVGATLFLSEERWAEFSYERRRSYVTWWCATMLSCLGVEVVDDPANPKPHPVPEGGRMVVSNHRSMLGSPRSRATTSAAGPSSAGSPASPRRSTSTARRPPAARPPSAR